MLTYIFYFISQTSFIAQFYNQRYKFSNLFPIFFSTKNKNFAAYNLKNNKYFKRIDRRFRKREKIHVVSTWNIIFDFIKTMVIF